MSDARAERKVAIRAVGLGRRFGNVRALRDVSFEVPAGVICGLIGPNGAGKTTLLRVLSGLDEPDEGTREMDGVDLGVDPHGARTRFGYVPDIITTAKALTAAHAPMGAMIVSDEIAALMPPGSPPDLASCWA